MFKNAGQKLKAVAKGSFFFSVFLSVIAALIFIEMTDTFLPIIIVPVVMVIAWNSTILLYSFGELCENVYHINETVQANAMRQYQNNAQYNAQNNGYRR